MTHCNSLNGKSSNAKLNKLKSGKRNGTETALNLSSNVIGDSNDETNFSLEFYSLMTKTSFKTSLSFCE